MRAAIWLPAVLSAGRSLARSTGDPEGWEDGSDLEHFVTRPDLTAPRYVVAKHHPDAITDGYWFVAPYSSLYDQPSFNGRREHVTGQTGPHIYDGDGNLVWSGASRYYNRDVFAFHPVKINETHQLTFHLASGHGGVEHGLPDHSAQIFMGSNYQEVGRINTIAEDSPVDFHAFKVLPGGERALVNYEFWDAGNATYPGGDGKERAILNAGFEDIDLSTGKAAYTWDAYKAGVELSESYDVMGRDEHDGYWDYIHLNSLDKDSDDDYYVSARHTSTIYKVSWLDKRIIWRLGGHNSSFSMSDGVRFNWQHHVRVRSHNATHTILSIFDNASEDQGRNPDIPEAPSSAKVIRLDIINMSATLLRNHTRPDSGHSRKLGNVQQIGEDIMTSTLFVDWAQQGYISEYDGEGRMVLEAKFVSDRMSSYRAYKFPWVGKPTEKPRCKILPTAISSNEHKVASAFYVSWNGATEVVAWVFYGSDDEAGPFDKLGSVRKIKFETSWITPGIVKYGYAQALDRDGNELAKSAIVTILPNASGTFKALSQLPFDLDAVAEQFEGTAQEQSSTPAKEDDSSFQSILVSLALVVVYAFAIFGLYSLGMKLKPLASRWRTGYQPLPVFKFSEEHLEDSRGFRSFAASGTQSAFMDLVDRRPVSRSCSPRR